MSKYILLLGRVFFSAIFILKSFEHFSPTMIHHASNMGVVMAPLLVPIAGIIALLGGLSILLGYKGKWGAWVLIVFLVTTAFSMHQFWQTKDPFALMMHQYCFWKNLSMAGAALMITYFGTGPLSLDKR